jgi:ribosomal protein L14
MKNHKFQALVTDGKISDALRKNIAECIAQYDGKIVIVTVQEKLPQRSIRQNVFFHAVILPAVQEWLRDNGTALSLDDTKDWIIKDIWKYTEYKRMPNGSNFEVRKSSTAPDIKLWQDFSQITYAWFAAKGLLLPEPEVKEQRLLEQ